MVPAMIAARAAPPTRPCGGFFVGEDAVMTHVSDWLEAAPFIWLIIQGMRRCRVRLMIRSRRFGLDLELDWKRAADQS